MGRGGFSGLDRLLDGGRGLALVLALAGGAWGAPAPDPPSARHLTEEDLLLFELRLDRVVLHDNFPAFAQGDGILLPLGELCRALDLAIQVDPVRGVAEGFLIDERRPFRLDGKGSALTVGGVTRTVDPALLEVRADDLYLDTRLLAQCLPLDLAVAKRTAVITLSAREELPLQASWKRQGSAGRLQRETAPKTFEPLADPYRLLEFPAVDTSLSLGASAPPGSSTRVAAQGSVLAAGDLLGLTTTLSAQGQSPGGITDFHMSMGRRDPHAGLLGPLKATQFLFGEVLDPGLNLVAAPVIGLGAMVTNQPLQTGNAFDRHSFQGDLPPGWQVELYQNHGLVAFQASRADGRYEFLNLKLYFGWNDFRLVFYGPQGQRREESVRFDVSTSQTPAGAWYYHVVGLEPHDLGGHRSQVQVSYGLTRQLAATFGTAFVAQGGRRQTLTEAGLQGFWKPLSGSLTAGWDGLGGTVGELALRTRLGDLSLVGKQTELARGFRSDVFPQIHGPIQGRTSLEANAPLPSLDRTWFTLDFGGYRDRLVAGGTADVLHLGLSTNLSGIYLSNQFSRSQVRGVAQPVPDTFTGDFLISKMFPALALRSQASYALNGGRRLGSLALSADFSRWDPFLFQAGLSHTINDRQTSVNMGVVKNQGAYSFGASLAYSQQSRLSANFTLRMGLALEPRGGQVFTKAQGTANFGAVSAQAFLDANANGRRDAGEQPVTDAAFKVNGTDHVRRTDGRGIVFLDGLPMDLDANIAIAANTLEDPLMRAQRPGVRVTSRPGHVVKLEVPIVFMSEINGTTYLLKEDRKVELPGVRLELRDAQGRVVKSLRSAYDGFFTFNEVPHGSYTLGVAAASARQLGAQPPPPQTFLLAPEGTQVDGAEILLSQVSAPGQAGDGPGTPSVANNDN